MSKDYRHIQKKEDYTKLLESGMFWEFHPELSGNWQDDDKVIKNINYDTVLAISVCKSYGSCYRPEKMQHEKECGKHCQYYKQTDS